MIEMALAYVRMGYPVLPCVPATKTPLTRHGLKNATLRPELVRLWWQHAPNANLGLLPPKGVLVLDADSGSAGDRWEASHAEVRAAPRARTPGGGAHYYLRLSEPSGLKARVKAGPEDAPVDVRGLGRAYVLAPPSRTHRGPYRWERPLTPLAHLPAASPELLARLLPQPPEPADRLPKVLDLHAGGRARRYALGALASEHDQLAGTPEGSRNATLNRAAYALGGYVARGVLLVEEVEMTLLAAAAQCGLPACEARRTLKSGLQAGLRAPRPLPATEQREEVA